MKKSSVLLSSLASLLLSTAVFADSGVFTPVPTNEGAPLRIMGNVQSQMAFAPSFQLRQLQGAAGVVYGVGMGFDVGAAVHFGGTNVTGMFKGPAPAASVTVAADSLNLGGDIMLRLLGNVTEMFYLGLQATGGLHYDFSKSASGFNTAASVPVTVGLALGLSFVDVVNVYLYPEVHFGGKKADAQNELWGTETGLSLAIGTMVNLGDVFGLTLEVKENWNDYRNSFTVWSGDGANTQVSLGFVYDM